MKICAKCKLPKDESDFHKKKINKDGLYSYCKECKSKIGKEYSKTKEGLITKIYSGQKTNSTARAHSLPSYSKKELSEWLFSQPNFDELFSNWAESNFNTLLTPSIDRLNDYLPYSMNNIRLTTWEENREKGFNDRKNGINNKASKSVVGTKISDGSKLKFHSISEASRKTGISRSNINGCCLNRKGFDSAGGYAWECK